MKKFITAGALCLVLGLLFIAWKVKDHNGKFYSHDRINPAFIVNSFDADRMRQHFKDTYNVTTEKVSYTVGDLKSIIANLNDNAKVEFFFGAYQAKDLNRYKLKSPQYYNMVKDKATLLIRVSSEKGKGTVIIDNASLCPPPNDSSCGDQPPPSEGDN
jgi:hypothetical protein